MAQEAFIRMVKKAPSLRVVDRLDIAELLHRYSWASDERRWEALGACFTEHAIFTIEIDGSPLRHVTRGRDAIVSMVRERHKLHFEAGQKRRHTTSGLVIEASGRVEATATSYVSVVIATDASIRIATSGWYRDELRRTDGAWRISHRLVHIDATA